MAATPAMRTPTPVPAPVISTSRKSSGGSASITSTLRMSSGSSIDAVLVAVAALVPPTLLGMYGGAVADAFPKRAALAIVYALQGALCFAVPTFLGTNLAAVIALIFALNVLASNVLVLNVFVSNVLVQSTLITAAVLSLTSLIAVQRVYRIVSPGIVRASWGVLAWLIFILALGDMALLWINDTQGTNRHQDWVVASVCLAASLFVVLACNLATTPRKTSLVSPNSSPSPVSIPSPNSTTAATSWTSSTPSASAPAAITLRSPSS